MKHRVKLLANNDEGWKGQVVVVDDLRGCHLVSHTMAEFIEYVKEEAVPPVDVPVKKEEPNEPDKAANP